MSAIPHPVLIEGPHPGKRRASSRLRTKLLALVAIAVIFLAGLETSAVVADRNQLIQAKRTEITSVVQNAWSVVDHFHQQELKGELSRDAAQRAAASVLDDMRYGGSNGHADYIFVRNAQGDNVAHGGNRSYVGTNAFRRTGDTRDPVAVMQEQFTAMRANGGQAIFNEQAIRPGATAHIDKLNAYKIFEPWKWSIGTGVFTDDLDALVRARIIRSIVTGIVLVLLLTAIGWLIARRVLAQIGGEPADVMGVMASAARGDLSRTLPAAPAGSLLSGFSTMSGAVRGMIAKVRDEAQAMKGDAESIADSVEQVSRASAAQSDATASMAAAVEELTVSVAHISHAAAETEKNSESVAQKCRDGEIQVTSAADSMRRIAGSVEDASDKMRGLEARAVQISTIASAIKDIAGQTNLLALNAAIEAARAGDQGRGFSVVADEVRKLAERTASATVEIEAMVANVQREASDSTRTMAQVLPMVAEGCDLTARVAAALAEIRLSADGSLERVREVANATREQSAASTSIAQQVESIAQMVEETTVAMSETSRSAQGMRDMADRLSTVVAAFKV